MKRLLKFGVKALVYSISGLLLIQANKLIVGGVLGVAALAVFSRPLALIRVIETFAAPPTSHAHCQFLQSSGPRTAPQLLLQAHGRNGIDAADGLTSRSSAIGSCCSGWAPLWGRPADDDPRPQLLQDIRAVARDDDLVGMNRHGWPAVATLTAAGLSALLGVLNAFVFGGGMTGAALAVALPLVGSAAFVATYACREFGVGGWTFVQALRAPFACGVPFALILVASRVLWPGRPALAVLGGLALAGPMILMHRFHHTGS
jgi:hypothetical protein